MTTERVIPLSDRQAWQLALASVPHAFAHTWGSCRAMQLTTGWETFLWTWEDGPARAVCALAERGDDGQRDVVTPFGFGGIVGVDVPQAALEQWGAFAEERGYVCAYIGLNPELGPAVCRQSADYTEHNDVYLLELDRGPDALHAGLSRNRRRQLEAFERSSARLVEDRERLAGYFLSHVDGFLAAKGATSTYAFTRQTWQALLELDEVSLLGVEEPNGHLAAAYLFATTAYSSEALFAVSDPNGQHYSAALTWAGALRLSERGIPRLNLGGGVRRGDGIAEFKERFGAVRRPLGGLKQVYRPTVYADLCSRVGADPADRSGFFPPYRAAGPAQSAPQGPAHIPIRRSD